MCLRVLRVTSALIYHFVAVPWARTMEIIQFERNFEWLTTTRYFLGSDLPHQQNAGFGSGYRQGSVPTDVL
jgi:hypothetical protein